MYSAKFLQYYILYNALHAIYLYGGFLPQEIFCSNYIIKLQFDTTFAW